MAYLQGLVERSGRPARLPIEKWEDYVDRVYALGVLSEGDHAKAKECIKCLGKSRRCVSNEVIERVIAAFPGRPTWNF